MLKKKAGKKENKSFIGNKILLTAFTIKLHFVLSVYKSRQSVFLKRKDLKLLLTHYPVHVKSQAFKTPSEIFDGPMAIKFVKYRCVGIVKVVFNL